MYRIACDSEDEAHAVLFAVAASMGYPAPGTRIGAGHPRGERELAGTTTEGSVERDGDQWFYRTAFGGLARVLEKPLEALAPDGSWQTVSPDQVPYSLAEVDQRTLWAWLSGFLREYLYDLDKNLRIDLQEIALERGQLHVVQSMNVPGSLGFEPPPEYLGMPLPVVPRDMFQLCVAREQWEAYPRLGERRDLVSLFRSFPEAFSFVLCMHLMRLSRIDELGYDEFQSRHLLALAARTFVSTTCHRFTREPRRFHVFDVLNDIAAAPYEGDPSVGTICFFERPEQVRWAMRFESPVALHDIRRVRKVLEMSDDVDVCLGSDSSAVFGLVETNQLPAVWYKARFRGARRWTFEGGGAALLEVIDGRPRVYRPAFDEKAIRERLAAFDGMEEIIKLIGEAVQQRRGTTVIVSDAAALEGKRLAKSAFCIVPAVLTGLAGRVTSIDGALLVGSDGTCHAVGVILDGAAEDGLGDPSRGARFNSALRYLASQRQVRCMAIVVSEDGYVDVLPRQDEAQAARVGA